MNELAKEIFHPLTKRSNLALLAVVTFLFATMGPFGTYDAHSFLYRLLCWSIVSVAYLVVGSVCYRISRSLFPPDRPILQDLAMAALTILSFTPLLWLLTRHHSFEDLPLSPSFLNMGNFATVITFCVCALRRIIPGIEPIGYFGAKSGQKSEGPRLTRRLSPEFSGPILRLSVRDHFVDVISATGAETIRMRFADAIDEMDTVAGYCTHRSHWVTRDAIAGSERDGSKIFLRLVNGDRVPVSRKYKPALEEAGLLGR